MHAADLLGYLTGLDIHLLIDDGELVIDAPAGALTPALREQIASNKADLLALLAVGDGTQSLQDGPHATMPAQPHQHPDAGILAHPDGIRHAEPYRCWYAGCTAVAAGPWRAIAPDCWQAECGAGHLIQRTAYSFEHPPEAVRGRPVALPASLPAEPMALWLYTRLHGIEPAVPAPANLTDEQIATAVGQAMSDYERLVRPATARYRKPTETRDPVLIDSILVAGERLGWPALQLRPGERLAAGEDCWRLFTRNGQASRLNDAIAAIARLADAVVALGVPND